MKRYLYCTLLMLLASATLFIRSAHAQIFYLKGVQVAHWDEKSSTTANARVDKSLAKNFKRYDVFSLDVKGLTDYVNAADGKASFVLQLGERYQWTMNIEPENLFSSDAKSYVLTKDGKKEIEVNRAQNIIYKGTLTGKEPGQVRLTLSDGKISVYITVNQEKFYLENLRDLNKATSGSNDDYIVYNGKDIISEGDLICQSKKDMHTDHDVQEKLKGARVDATCDGIWENQLATYATYNRFNSAGGATAVNTEILTILNNVQGNYNEFKVKLVIVEQIVSSCSTCDPWGALDFNISSLLDKFTAWGPTGFTQTHDQGICFFDGPGSGSVGFAWVGSICTKNRYNVCDKLASAESNRVLVAHEMGHNFGANHDASGSGFIMAPSVNSTNVWSGASITSITQHIASRTCLSCTTVTPTPTCSSPSSLLVESVQSTGASFKWNGVSGATGYTVQVKLASATTWQSYNATTSNLNVTGLQAGATYQWQVRTNCSAGNSAYASGANFTTTTTTPPVCASPSGLGVTNVLTTSAAFSWNDASGAAGYTFQIKTTSATTWQSFNVTPSNLSINSGLQPGTTYQWQVRTNCSAGNSAYVSGANFTTTTTNPIPTTCNSPSGLIIESAQATSARLNWNDVAGATGYTFQVKMVSSSSWQSFNVTNSNLNLSGMQAGVVYQWRVRANCASGSSAYANGPNINGSAASTATLDAVEGNEVSLSGVNVTDTVVYLDEAATPSIEVSPNPYNQSFTLKINQSTSEFADVYLISLTGKLMYQLEKHPVSRTLTLGDKLSAGMYIIRVKTLTSVYTTKVIKN